MDALVRQPKLGRGRAKRKGTNLEAAIIKAAAGKKKTERVQIAPPNFQQAKIRIVGDAPLVIHAFSSKQQKIMEEKQQLGQQAKKGAKREAKNFEEDYNRARHISTKGWDGLPAAAFRSAMISACRTVGFKMTLAKLSLFVVADGFDRENGDPLVKITKGSPKEDRRPVRNSSGVTDIRARPMWMPNWEAIVTVKWDADQFTATDVINLMARVGGQVGICEGRPDSKMSAGCGWGTFVVKQHG